MKKTVEECIAKANELMENGDYRIHLGIDRRAIAKEWNGQRVYINIYCYTASGNYKGKYDCGYVDKATGEYVTTRYTDVDLFDGAEAARCATR